MPESVVGEAKHAAWLEALVILNAQIYGDLGRGDPLDAGAELMLPQRPLSASLPPPPPPLGGDEVAEAPAAHPLRVGDKIFVEVGISDGPATWRPAEVRVPPRLRACPLTPRAMTPRHPRGTRRPRGRCAPSPTMRPSTCTLTRTARGVNSSTS